MLDAQGLEQLAVALLPGDDVVAAQAVARVQGGVKLCRDLPHVHGVLDFALDGRCGAPVIALQVGDLIDVHVDDIVVAHRRAAFFVRDLNLLENATISQLQPAFRQVELHLLQFDNANAFIHIRVLYHL